MRHTNRYSRTLSARNLVTISSVLVFASLLGCSAKEEEKKVAVPEIRTPITVTTVKKVDLEVTESAIGFATSKLAPRVGAEVTGMIKTVLVDVGQVVKKGELLAEIDPEEYELNLTAQKANVARLQTQIKNQQKTTDRFQKLRRERTISQGKLDDAEAQLAVFKAQLDASKAVLSLTKRKLRKTKIIAPVDGQIDARMISEGDFVKVGATLFKITNPEVLRITFPFPEVIAREFTTGQPVRLKALGQPEHVNSTISDIRPNIASGSRSLNVIVDINNPGEWKSGSSVSGEIIVATKRDALVVPKLAVVRRPIGKIVYVVENDRAIQIIVQTGYQKNSSVEITKGLTADARIVLDGAGFLTDQAAVEIKGEL